jgi:protein gp37
MWNPWRGCHKYSEGCRFCYIHKGDAKRNVDTNQIRKTKSFYAPLDKKNGEYVMRSGSTVYLCFSTDFLIEEADSWRDEIFEIIKKRSDLHFVFLTKRIERLSQCLPRDWKDGYENVTVGATIENQEVADIRLPIFKELKIKHKNIVCQPLLGLINLEGFLDDIELVIVGGEADYNGREMHYDWVLAMREQCVKANVAFQFRQCSTNFIKDNILYKLNTKQLASQAKKSDINFKPKER